MHPCMILPRHGKISDALYMRGRRDERDRERGERKRREREREKRERKGEHLSPPLQSVVVGKTKIDLITCNRRSPQGRCRIIATFQSSTVRSVVAVMCVPKMACLIDAVYCSTIGALISVMLYKCPSLTFPL